MLQLRPYQIELVDAVKQAWRNGFTAPCIVLGCGGGKSCIVAEIARRTTWKQNQVLFLVHRRELVNQIFHTFVECGVDMTYCQIGMVQTVVRRLHSTLKPSLIITDENHHSLASSYKKIYDFFPNARRVGVTATPIRLNGDGLGDVNDTLISGKSTKWMIENGYLAPYDYYSPNIVDLTDLHIKRGEFVTSEVESVMIKKAIFGDIISCYEKLASNKKAICYCSSIKHSIATTDAFNAVGISAAHIDATTQSAERHNIITKFRNGEITILCNVDLISEGFDVPDCECSILLRPTQSLALYIQQSMRCMRFQPNKQAVIIDHVGNYARFGMPDADRTWSLEKKDKNKKEKVEIANSVTQCPECFYTFANDPTSEKKVCPQCGHEFARKIKQDLESEEDAELVKIEGFTLNFKTPNECNSYRELQDYAKKHNYKPGWCYYQAKKRGLA